MQHLRSLELMPSGPSAFQTLIFCSSFLTWSVERAEIGGGSLSECFSSFNSCTVTNKSFTNQVQNLTLCLWTGYVSSICHVYSSLPPLAQISVACLVSVTHWICTVQTIVILDMGCIWAKKLDLMRFWLQYERSLSNNSNRVWTALTCGSCTTKCGSEA